MSALTGDVRGKRRRVGLSPEQKTKHVYNVKLQLPPELQNAVSYILKESAVGAQKEGAGALSKKQPLPLLVSRALASGI